MRRSRRGLLAGAVLLTSTGALVAACGAFDEASAPDGTDAATADAASPDVPSPHQPDGGLTDAPVIDGAACANGVAITEPFTALSPEWQTTAPGTATVGIGSSPDAGPGPTGSVLRAAVDVPDGGSSKAYVTRILDVTPLASIDLSYVVLLAAKPMYAETGCQLSLRNKKAPGFTANMFSLSRDVDGSLSFASVTQIDNVVASESELPTLIDVTGPAHWYSVDLHVELTGNAGRASVTVRDLARNVSRELLFPNVPLVSGIDAVQLDCGIYYANSGVGELESAVDEVSLTACPR